MAKKFLDKDGLSHFWAKIKEKLAGKVDTSTYSAKMTTIDNDLNTLFDDKAEASDLTALQTTVTGLQTSKQDKISAGTGIEISGNTVSAKIPEMLRKQLNDTQDRVFKGIEYDTTTNKFVLRNYDATSATGVSDVKKAIATVDDITAAQVTIDTALSTTSTNPVQNKVINTALGGKVDKVSGKGLSTNDYTTTEKTKLNDLPTKAQLDTTFSSYALKSDITSLYKPGGNKTFTQLTQLTLASVPVGTVYNITDDFTTNANFLEGAGIDYKAGTNVVCVLDADGTTHKWDALGGIDMEEITNSEIDTIVAS